MENTDKIDKENRDFLRDKMQGFRSLDDNELIARLHLEIRKGYLEEETRGGKGATTSDTNWNINVLKMIAEERGLKYSKKNNSSQTRQNHRKE